MECTQCGASVPPGRTACPTCGASTAAGSPAAAAIDALLAEANLYRTRKQYDVALSTCTRILQADPTNYPAHALIANIYRDQHNYREALNWFKLALELNPDSEDDKKKHAEMVEQVFQGVISGNPNARPGGRPAAAARPAASDRPDRETHAVQRFLRQLQPVHIVIASTILVVLISIPVVMSQHAPPARSARPRAFRVRPDAPPDPTAAVPSHAANTAVALAPVANSETAAPPAAAPPPADAVESGGLRPVPGLPGVAVRIGPSATSNTAPPAATAAPTAPSPADAGVRTPATVAPPQVPPLNPLDTGVATPADEIKMQELLLKMTLDTMLAKSRLPSTLDDLTIDPRDNTLTLQYVIPTMADATAVKRGLLYSGFNLIWAALEQNTSLTRVVLRGYAGNGPDRDPSLALIADVAPDQARAARTAQDYRTVHTYLSNTWWRADLKDAAL